MKYTIPDDKTLDEVYRMWLIAIEPEVFASDNNLSFEQLTAFRGVTQYSWKQFREERSKL